MGYYIKARGSNFKIRRDNIEKFFELVSNLMSIDTMEKYASGGSYSNGKKNSYWYSWIDTERVKTAIQNRDIFAFFEEWRYDISHNTDEGNDDFICTHISPREGEQKIGDEELLFVTIAPVVENGSYLEMVGEDSEMWEWIWNDGKFFVADAGEVVYGTPREQTLDNGSRAY